MTHSKRRQRGTSLIEALVSTLVLSLGVLAVTQVQHGLRLGAEVARDRAEALQMAQRDLERLRSFGSLDGADSYAAIASATIEPDASSQAAFTLTRSITDDADGGHKSAHLRVAWQDRDGGAQQVMLDSLIAGQSPSLAATLSIQRERLSAQGARNRAASIPTGAMDVGDGRSIWKPSAAGTIAYVFDNATGRVKAQCKGIAAQAGALQLATLLKAGQLSCSDDDALLLSGLVRVSTAAPPDPKSANEVAPVLAVALTLYGKPPQEIACTTEAQQAVEIKTATGTRRTAVALDATPASLGVAGWTELGDRFVAYHCRVPRQAGGWSGRSHLVPDGWTLGTLPADRRVCRYTAAADDGDSPIPNADHPDEYHAVDDALMQQNFLLIRGDQACPATTALHQP